MIKLFPLTAMNHTVFNKTADLAYLREHSIELTESMEKADIFVARKLKPAIFKMLDEWPIRHRMPNKPLLIWTHEPRYAATSSPLITNLLSVPVHVMNMYTNDVFFSNFTMYGNKIGQPLENIREVVFAPRPICALATYVYSANQQFMIEGVNLDLAMKRQLLILRGHQAGVVDVYGKGWPENISLAESRHTNRETSKLGILANYQFNICLENTAWPYYCTEKIWESIKGYCLPVYSSFNNRIYETFPEDSFIDFDRFGSEDELLLFATNMSKKEFLRRMNICIDVYNHACNTIDMVQEKKKSLDALINKIRCIAEKTE